MGEASTWENFSRLHSWSSPGWWPGKSVDVTFVTVSALTPTIFVKLAHESWKRPMIYHTFRRRASSGDIGTGAMMVAILQFCTMI